CPALPGSKEPRRARSGDAGGRCGCPFQTCPLATKHAGPSPLSQGSGRRLQMERPVRVLLIEDHKPLVRALRQGLEEEGFAVDVATEGDDADYKARTAEYDVIILDLMLPKRDGLTLLQGWRKAGITTHVLVLTARGA